MAKSDKAAGRSGPDFSLEKAARKSGHQLVAGVDEAGRGPLAGPVVVAAAILPEGFTLDGVDDSKKVTEARREALFDQLVADSAIAYHVEVVPPSEIDQVNILEATRNGMRRSVLGLKARPDFVLIDGTPVPDFPIDAEAVVKGDGKSLSIAVASILAKVTRDRIMRKLALDHPEYGFDRHKGYPTKHHLEMLREHGPVEAHRRSFAPVAQLTLDLGI